MVVWNQSSLIQPSTENNHVPGLLVGYTAVDHETKSITTVYSLHKHVSTCHHLNIYVAICMHNKTKELLFVSRMIKGCDVWRRLQWDRIQDQVCGHWNDVKTFSLYSSACVWCRWKNEMASPHFLDGRVLGSFDTHLKCPLGAVALNTKKCCTVIVPGSVERGLNVITLAICKDSLWRNENPSSLYVKWKLNFSPVGIRSFKEDLP